MKKWKTISIYGFLFSYTLLGDFMKINLRAFLFSIFVSVFLGSVVGFLTASSNNYMDLVSPSFAPPAIVFPIVWTILYILMGISSYLIFQSNDDKKNEALFVYGCQLIINLLWSFLFFSFRQYLLAFLWILLLIGFVVVMILKFYKINKTSAYLQIPYLVWLVFASILNLFVFFLN